MNRGKLGNEIDMKPLQSSRHTPRAARFGGRRTDHAHRTDHADHGVRCRPMPLPSNP